MSYYAVNTNLDPKNSIEQQASKTEGRFQGVVLGCPRWLTKGLATMAALAALVAIPAQGEVNRVSAKQGKSQPQVAISKVSKTEKQWQTLLTSEQFKILRRAGTESAFDNRYHDHKADGNYACAACGNRLFASSAKFDSGTGWPSFSQPLDAAATSNRPDNTWFAKRTEVVCSRCDGHLGHVFEDGPQPTGKRYCVNSAAMTFYPHRSE